MVVIMVIEQTLPDITVTPGRQGFPALARMIARAAGTVKGKASADPATGIRTQAEFSSRRSGPRELPPRGRPA